MLAETEKPSAKLVRAKYLRRMKIWNLEQKDLFLPPGYRQEFGQSKTCWGNIPA